MGYPLGYKGYKVLDLDTKVISITRNVIFHENVFPFLKHPLMSDIFHKDMLPDPISMPHLIFFLNSQILLFLPADFIPIKITPPNSFVSSDPISPLPSLASSSPVSSTDRVH